MTGRGWAWLGLVALAAACGNDDPAPTPAPSSPAPVSAAPAARHEACLAAIERLEEGYARDPAHLRELCETYLAVLPFERRTGYGANVSLLLSRRLPARDAPWVRRARAALHLFMHQYPLAAALTDPATDSVLAALRQDRYLEMPPLDVGPLRARVYRTARAPPDADEFHDELHFLFARDDAAAPHRIVAYTLTAGQGRYYLFLHSLNRSHLIDAFGKSRPAYVAVAAAVRAHAASALERAG